MGFLSRRLERAVEHRSEHRVTGDDRAAFAALATGLLGRDRAEGSSFDARVSVTLGMARPGSEGPALRMLAAEVRDHGVRITIDELGAFGRCARLFGVAEDDWTFLGANVER